MLANRKLVAGLAGLVELLQVTNCSEVGLLPVDETRRLSLVQLHDKRLGAVDHLWRLLGHGHYSRATDLVQIRIRTACPERDCSRSQLNGPLQTLECLWVGVHKSAIDKQLIRERPINYGRIILIHFTFLQRNGRTREIIQNLPFPVDVRLRLLEPNYCGSLIFRQDHLHVLRTLYEWLDGNSSSSSDGILSHPCAIGRRLAVFLVPLVGN